MAGRFSVSAPAGGWGLRAAGRDRRQRERRLEQAVAERQPLIAEELLRFRQILVGVVGREVVLEHRLLGRARLEPAARELVQQVPEPEVRLVRLVGRVELLGQVDLDPLALADRLTVPLRALAGVRAGNVRAVRMNLVHTVLVDVGRPEEGAGGVVGRLHATGGDPHAEDGREGDHQRLEPVADRRHLVSSFRN